jgi:hypothetical protein
MGRELFDGAPDRHGALAREKRADTRALERAHGLGVELSTITD